MSLHALIFKGFYFGDFIEVTDVIYLRSTGVKRDKRKLSENFVAFLSLKLHVLSIF